MPDESARRPGKGPGPDAPVPLAVRLCRDHSSGDVERYQASLSWIRGDYPLVDLAEGALALWITRAARPRSTEPGVGMAARLLGLFALPLPTRDRERFVGEVLANMADLRWRQRPLLDLTPWRTRPRGARLCRTQDRKPGGGRLHDLRAVHAARTAAERRCKAGVMPGGPIEEGLAALAVALERRMLRWHHGTRIERGGALACSLWARLQSAGPAPRPEDPVGPPIGVLVDRSLRAGPLRQQLLVPSEQRGAQGRPQ